MAKREVFIERRHQGDYAVRNPNSERASAVLPTQRAAIDWAKDHKPEAARHIERVRHTSHGHPDKWRSE